jgi:glycosyltransferase involved in cell wall biosynthesis
VEASQSGVVPVAYAHSKPVIATRTGGLPDVIDDGQTGLLVDPKDAVGLANAVIQLLKDKQRCQSMGAAGYQKLQNEFSPEVVCKQTTEVYQSAIDERNLRNHPANAELSKSTSR